MKININKVFWQRFGVAAPLVGLASIWVMSRVANVLPKIMGDELTYSMDARKLALGDSTVPNYLFNLLFSSTNVCGYNFYGCAKGINLALLIGVAAVVYLLGRKLTTPSLAFFAALLVMVGPISSYVSYFSPDLMFYLGALIVVYMALDLASDSKVTRWAVLGGSLGLVTLIKPHALFLLPPLVIYVLYLAAKRPHSRLVSVISNSMALIATTFIVKMGLGFAFAGTKGLALFGGNYDSAATKVVNLGAQVSEPTGPAAPGAMVNLANPTASDWSFRSLSWLEPLSQGMAFHLSFYVLFFGVPSVALFVLTFRALRVKSAPLVAEKFMVLSACVVLFSTFVSVAYVALSPAWGEPLGNRVMVRYYEYALPLVTLTLLATASVDLKIKTWAKWFTLGICATALIFSIAGISSSVPPLFTDSSLIASAMKSGISLYVLGVLALGALAYWLWSPKQGRNLWLYIFSPALVLLFAVSSYVNMTIPSSHVGMYTTASRWAHDNLTPTQKHNLVVYGNIRQNVQAAQFWVDDPTVTGQTVPVGGTVDLQTLPVDTYVVGIGNLVFSGHGILVHKETSFLVARVTK